jgi:hypothetical protein
MSRHLGHLREQAIVAPKLRTCPVYCPKCHVYESLLFYGNQLVGNTKWRQGRGGNVYHCGCACIKLSLN